MRLLTTIVAVICASLAHAAHLAPWNPDGDGMRAGTVESVFGAFTAETGVGIAASVAGGLVPVYGQMADARDTAANIKNVWDNPNSGEARTGLAMSGVAWLPGVGDAAKGAYKGGRRVAKEVGEGVVKSSDNVIMGTRGMMGASGARITSKTVWTGKGCRIDVENPAPGVRPGQLHYQDSSGNKYLFDPIRGEFIGAPRSVNNQMDNPCFRQSIEKGLKYLGESL